MNFKLSNPEQKLLQKILSQPTAPFREGYVISEISRTLKESQVPHFLDPIGNLVVGVDSRKAYLEKISHQNLEPLRFFIAHLDHPGFHGTQWLSRNRLQVKWLGGSPTQHLEGAQVWLATYPKTWMTQGILEKVQLKPSGLSIDSATVVLSENTNQDSSQSLASSIFGGFSFRSPWWQEGELLYTQAADDLVSASVITSLALKTSETPWIGLLTRAEEVGFIGAIGHFELGWLDHAQRSPLCISLETSRTLLGAEIGKGPVVRLGDKFTVFDPGTLRVFSDLAQEILPNRHQKRIMDGGTCEATVATVFGFHCMGISVPLGNYHNQSLEGGPDSSPAHGPAPEFVHLEDVSGMSQLCQALLTPGLPWNKPWGKKMNEFKKEQAAYTHLLQSGA